MDLDELIQMILDGKYKDKNGEEFNILYRREQKEAVSEIVYQWGAKQRKDADLYKQLGELEAKCFAYEQIIMKSNFKPFITDGRIEFNYIKK